jgi:hypothetical protein
MVMHPFDAFAQSSAPHGALIARAKSLELDTPYVPPPGDALEHHAAGFAKIMCSAVFVTGLNPDFAAENVGYFTAPYEVRHKLGKPGIDRVEKAVHVTLPNGVTRTAKYLGSQGCVTLAVGQTSVNFTPANVVSLLPDPSTQPWPMGDVLSDEPLPPEIDATKLKQAMDAAGPALTDLLAGQVQVSFPTMPASIEHIRAGRLHALAVTTATRSDALPDLPTVGEFLPGYEVSNWYGLGVPRATPPEIVDKLNTEINAGLADPKMKARLAEWGATALPGSPVDFGKLIAEETEKWSKVVKFTGIKAD